MKSLLEPLKNQRGMALIMAIFALTLITVILADISYETSVEYVGSSQSINRIKAYYAAKAGVEFSLYRILLYKKALKTYASKLQNNRSLLDPIWQLPFMWPPTPIAEMNSVDKEQMEDIVKESAMSAQYMVTIQSEGGKIDINELGSPHKVISDGIRQQLLQIFKLELERNEKFKEKYEYYDFEKLIGNLKDWVDEDSSGESGGDESTNYDQPDDAPNFKLPPNAPFKTISELHMVKDMEDTFFDLLKDRVTIYGSMGINVNYCSKDILELLDPQIRDEKLQKILTRRDNPKEGGPFADENDFFNFLESIGVRTDDLRKLNLPLLFEPEFNFRIVSTGLSGNVRRQINAVVFDVGNLTSRYSEILDKACQDKNANDPDCPKPNTNNQNNNNAKGTAPVIEVPKGRPTIVLWQES